MARKRPWYSLWIVIGVAGVAAVWGLAARLEAAGRAKAALTRGFQRGATDHRSIGALAFGPSGILFFADPQGDFTQAVQDTRIRRLAAHGCSGQALM